MPAYNAAFTLDTAIESVRLQTYSHWELWVIDDGSTDDTRARAERWRALDKRVQVIDSGGSGCGPACARNQGLMRSRGRYIAFLDADDWWQQNKLADQVECLKKTGASFIFSSYLAFRDGETRGWVMPAPRQITFERLLHHNAIGCLTVLYDRKLLGLEFFEQAEVGALVGVSGTLGWVFGHEDYLAWLRLLDKIEKNSLPPAIGLVDIMACRRVRSDSFSSSKIKALSFVFLIYFRFFGFSLSRSLIMLLRYVVVTAYRKSRPADWQRVRRPQ